MVWMESSCSDMKLTRERDGHRLGEYGSCTYLSSRKDATVFFDDNFTDGKQSRSY
jgi:hypothetical protein